MKAREVNSCHYILKWRKFFHSAGSQNGKKNIGKEKKKKENQESKRLKPASNQIIKVN